MSLVVCAACSRHVRRTETTCPFCDASITSVIANAPERALPATRLGRAALFAFATASVGSVACGGDTSGSGKQNQTVADGGFGNTYGAPPSGGAGGRANAGTGGELGVALYGAPFGGNFGAGGTLATGGESGTGGEVAQPMYGGPFPPPHVEDAGADAAKGGAGGTGGEGPGTGGSFQALYGVPSAP